MSNSKGECGRCGPGRPRSEQSRDAILQATLDMLEEQSLREISIEAIACRAKVGKATIYKWWSGKAYLALDAFLVNTYRHAPVPDTGNAQEDILQHVASLARFYQSHSGRLFVQFLAEGQSDPEFREDFWNVFISERRRAVTGMVLRGVERGELRADVDVEVILDLLYAPMIYRLMVGHRPLDADAVRDYVAVLLQGLGAGNGEDAPR